MISKEEVEHIAKLARLELTEAEIEKMQKDLSVILDYFGVLENAPKLGKAESAFVKDSALRKDEAEKHGISDKIIKAAPDKKDSYIKVRTIL